MSHVVQASSVKWVLWVNKTKEEMRNSVKVWWVTSSDKTKVSLLEILRLNMIKDWGCSLKNNQLRMHNKFSSSCSISFSSNRNTPPKRILMIDLGKWWLEESICKHLRQRVLTWTIWRIWHHNRFRNLQNRCNMSLVLNSRMIKIFSKSTSMSGRSRILD